MGGGTGRDGWARDPLCMPWARPRRLTAMPGVRAVCGDLRPPPTQTSLPQRPPPYGAWESRNSQSGAPAPPGAAGVFGRTPPPAGASVECNAAGGSRVAGGVRPTTHATAWSPSRALGGRPGHGPARQRSGIGHAGLSGPVPTNSPAAMAGKTHQHAEPGKAWVSVPPPPRSRKGFTLSLTRWPPMRRRPAEQIPARIRRTRLRRMMYE